MILGERKYVGTKPNLNNMKKGLIKSITSFLKKVIGILYSAADKHSDSVVLAIEWSQGILEGNEEKARKIVESTKGKFDDKILNLAIKELPNLLKEVKEVKVLLDGSESNDEFWQKVKGKIVLDATEKRRFYTDLATSLLLKFVKIPDWVATIITQFAFGRVFKS